MENFTYGEKTVYKERHFNPATYQWDIFYPLKVEVPKIDWNQAYLNRINSVRKRQGKELYTELPEKDFRYINAGRKGGKKGAKHYYPNCVRKVISKETGVIYSSAKECAEDNYISYAVLTARLRENNKVINNTEFEYLPRELEKEL
jgi:hypothetical protein